MGLMTVLAYKSFNKRQTDDQNVQMSEIYTRVRINTNKCEIDTD